MDDDKFCLCCGWWSQINENLKTSLSVHRAFRCTATQSFLSPIRLETWNVLFHSWIYFHEACFGNMYCDAEAGWRKQYSQLSSSGSSHVIPFIPQPRLITALCCWWPLGLEPLEPIGLQPLMHLFPLLAPKDQSPPFVIGKHAEELVCALQPRQGAGWENKEDRKISIFPRDEVVCTKPGTPFLKHDVGLKLLGIRLKM